MKTKNPMVMDEVDASNRAAEMFERVYYNVSFYKEHRTVVKRLLHALLSTMLEIEKTGVNFKPSEWHTLVCAIAEIRGVSLRSLIKEGEQIETNSTTFPQYLAFLRKKTKPDKVRP